MGLGWEYTFGNGSNWVAFKAVKLNKRTQEGSVEREEKESEN